jgi:hypothetical protein
VNGLRRRSSLHPEHVLDEAVTFLELLGNCRCKTAVKVFAGSELLGERVPQQQRSWDPETSSRVRPPEPKETVRYLHLSPSATAEGIAMLDRSRRGKDAASGGVSGETKPFSR